MEAIKVPLIAYLPFINAWVRDPVRELGKQLYSLLSEKMQLQNWKTSINNKLEIITDIHMIYQHNTERIKDDILTTLIIILILTELLVAILKN